MAIDILSRYGIKEVADVTFYELVKKEGKVTKGAPVLFLDTLKVSNIEQTAESTSARGGKGNPELITWDFGKEITLTLEDALYSPKSLATQYGATLDAEKAKIYKTVRPSEIKNGSITINDKTYTVTGDPTYYDANGKSGEGITAATAAYAVVELPVADSITVKVDANTFPGTYCLVGDTYARNEETGKDDFFQFELPKIKVLSESNTITLEAEGDPTVFSMSIKVLKQVGEPMMKLTQYTLTETSGN